MRTVWEQHELNTLRGYLQEQMKVDLISFFEIAVAQAVEIMTYGSNHHYS